MRLSIIFQFKEMNNEKTRNHLLHNFSSYYLMCYTIDVPRLSNGTLKLIKVKFERRIFCTKINQKKQ